jgi:DNA-directed RNA polymerase subunit M/transcription elongation factor TFIIS
MSGVRKPETADARFDRYTKRLLPMKKQNEVLDKFTCALYECGKCHKRQSRFVEKQDRALDEGTSTYVQCVCGEEWRIRG